MDYNSTNDWLTWKPCYLNFNLSKKNFNIKRIKSWNILIEQLLPKNRKSKPQNKNQLNKKDKNKIKIRKLKNKNNKKFKTNSKRKIKWPLSLALLR